MSRPRSEVFNQVPQQTLKRALLGLKIIQNKTKHPLNQLK